MTAGLDIEERLAAFERTHDDYHAIMLKALADRFAEAAAEWLHASVRKEFWGYAPAETLEQRRADQKPTAASARPRLPGLPRPHREGRSVQAPRRPARTGMALTDSFAMTRRLAVSGFYFAHPDAHYFAGQQDRPRPAGGLGAAHRHDRGQKPSAGWRRCEGSSPGPASSSFTL